MSDELDRKLIPELLQTTFAVSLGAAFKSVEMMKDPIGSMNKMVSEARSLLTIPSDAGEGLQKKAEAVASVWMEKAAAMVDECKTAGEKFTQGK